MTRAYAKKGVGASCYLLGYSRFSENMGVGTLPALSTPPLILVRDCSEASVSGRRDGSEEVRTRIRESVAKVKRKRRETVERA